MISTWRLLEGRDTNLLKGTDAMWIWILSETGSGQIALATQVSKEPRSAWFDSATLMLPEKMCGTCVFSMRFPFVSKAGAYKNRIYHRNCQQLRCSYLCNNHSGGIRLKACEDVDVSLFSGECGLWGNISDSAWFSFRQGQWHDGHCCTMHRRVFNAPWWFHESGTGFAMIYTYDTVWSYLCKTNCRYHKHGKKLKDSGFRSLVKSLSCWTICEQYHQVSSTSRAQKKTQVLHVCPAWGRDDRGNCVPIIDCFLSKRLYCTAGLLCQLESHRWIS